MDTKLLMCKFDGALNGDKLDLLIYNIEAYFKAQYDLIEANKILFTEVCMGDHCL